MRAAVDGQIAVETTEYGLGAKRWHATGETLPGTVLAAGKQSAPAVFTRFTRRDSVTRR
jgi:hypothetical protein